MSLHALKFSLAHCAVDVWVFSYLLYQRGSGDVVTALGVTAGYAAPHTYEQSKYESRFARH
jgi:hypothetical protein